MTAAGPSASKRAFSPRGRQLAATRLRRLAAAVRDADRLREAVFRGAPDAIVISDGDGRVREVNPAADTLFGRPPGSLLGHWMSDLLAGTGKPSNPDCGNMLAALGRRIVLEGLGVDGTRFPAEVTVQRVGHGRRTRFAAYIRDLSAERRAAAGAEAQRKHLAEIEKLSAMGSLLSGVAHELNNPLAIVVAQATLLRERAQDDAAARRAERIQAAAQRAGRIVRSFAALGTRGPARSTPVVLAEAFAEARDLVGHGLRKAGIVVEEAFPAGLPRVAGDADLIVQVFAALLLNAQEALATRDGERRVRVRAAPGPCTVTVEVADNGPGVDAAVADRLFEPYATTKPAGSGLGIGLSLCRSIMGQHGGTIEHRPGHDGALFRLVLPRAAAALEEHPVAQARAGLRVLVVDDEADVARALAELIEIHGHSVAVAAAAADALARLDAGRFDAVFTDLNMPHLDGAALRTRIAERHPHLRERTVLVTGDLRQRTEAVHGPDALVLEKPFTAEAVRSLLSRWAPA